MKANLSILVVDDDAETRRVLQTLLLSLGAGDVDLVSSAEMALARLQDCRYDLVLSDYRMEGMNGVAFTQRLRELGNRTPVLLLSGAPDRKAVLQALRQPGVEFFGKPFEISVLEGAVDRLVAA